MKKEIWWHKGPMELEIPWMCVPYMCRRTHWSNDQRLLAKSAVKARKRKCSNRPPRRFRYNPRPPPVPRYRVWPAVILAVRFLVRKNGFCSVPEEDILPQELKQLLHKIRSRHLRLPAKRIKRVECRTWAIRELHPSHLCTLCWNDQNGHRRSTQLFIPRWADKALHLYVTGYFSIRSELMPCQKTLFWAALRRNPHVDNWQV